MHVAGEFSTEAVYNPNCLAVHACCMKGFFAFDLLVDMMKGRPVSLRLLWAVVI